MFLRGVQEFNVIFIYVMPLVISNGQTTVVLINCSKIHLLFMMFYIVIENMFISIVAPHLRIYTISSLINVINNFQYLSSFLDITFK